MPLVSVVIPAFNAARYLDEALGSVLAQALADVEIIVVDDGSTDDTPNVLAAYGTKVTVLRQENRGIARARNRGIAAARGELVAFLDADDYWLEGKLEAQLRLFDGRDEVALVYSDVRVRDDGGLRPGTLFSACRPRRGRVFDHLLRESFVSTAATIVRRRCLDDVGGFDDRYTICDDYDLWLRLAARYALDYVDAPLAVYRRHGEGVTRNAERALGEAFEITAAHARAAGVDGTRAVRRRLASLCWQLGITRLENGAAGAARAAFMDAARLDRRSLRPYVGFALSAPGGRRLARMLRGAIGAIGRPARRSTRPFQT